RNLVRQHVPRPNCRVVRRTLCGYLLVELWSTDEVAEEVAVEFCRVDVEQEVVATDDSPFEILRYDSITPELGVDLRYQELAGTADLLSFRLNFRPGHVIPKDDSLGMQLHPASLIGFEIADLDELLAVRENFSQRNC